MEPLMMTRHCACCGKPFEPRPQVPDQAYCSEPDCQRTRKRQWQRAKIQSDPDYRINQRAAQLAWSQRNQNYWRTYRDDCSGPGRLDSHRAGIS
jgi:predicted nucleic acid-binding Zn ribbon protein